MKKLDNFILEGFGQELTPNWGFERYLVENLSNYYQGNILNESLISEALIEFGRNKQEQQFGQVIVFAGGAGSGKGFILNNMLGNKGIQLDVDYFKEVAPHVDFIRKGIKDKFGVNVEDMNLKNPQDVSDLHEFLGKRGLNLKNRKFGMVFNSVMLAPKDRKPNIIFDMTMKDMSDIQEVRNAVVPLGYDEKNINVIWVINSIEKALEQNANRSRTVDSNLLIDIHHGVANTMKDLIFRVNRLPFDGEFWMVFNKEGVDNLYKSTEKKGGYSEYLKGKQSAGGYFDFVTNIRIKERGKAIDTNKLDNTLKKKLAEYTEVNF